MDEKLRTLDHREMGRRIRFRRESLNLSREKLAEKLDVSSQFIADVEYGNKGMSSNNLFLLSQILDVSMDYLIAGKILPGEKDGEVARVREEIMATLRKCDAKQLEDIGKIAWIFADRNAEKH